MAGDPGGRPVVRLRGRVDRRAVGRGTKSERVTVVLETHQEVLVMRARHGPSFGPTGYERYVGRDVACTGTIVGHVLLVDEIDAD
jgi:hypothetical protein